MSTSVRRPASSDTGAARPHRFHALSRDDFPSDEAYNDHLEMVEDILFDLTYGDPDQVAQAERYSETVR